VAGLEIQSFAVREQERGSSARCVVKGRKPLAGGVCDCISHGYPPFAPFRFHEAQGPELIPSSRPANELAPCEPYVQLVEVCFTLADAVPIDTGEATDPE
jgi:hypothetical protein